MSRHGASDDAWAGVVILTMWGFRLSGHVLAAYLSWGANESFWWALLHFFLSWLYVIYYVVVHQSFG